MSASKSKVTNSILKSEKKSLFRFLTLYFVMITVMMLSLGLYYYDTQKQITLAQYKATLSKYAYVHIKKLKALHHYFPQERQYPRSNKYASAIYDIDKTQIFSLLHQPKIDFDKDIYIKDGYVHYIKTLDTYYLGTRYLILEVRNDSKWLNSLYKRLLLYASISFVIFGLLGLFLAHLFIKPLRDSVMLLDRFIKDTTHELNTPLSTILANIEMMDREVMAKKNLKKLDRINSAAKAVSVLYKDLTYLTLEQHKNNNNEEINLKELIKERCEYFDILAKSKNITFELDLQDANILIDRNKITRVIDNLISNAIKYNKRNGIIQITIKNSTLIIQDNGIGIAKNKIPYMFDRYMRFDSSEGGFGVGLSIVKNIIDEYGMSINVESELNQGTRIEIKWQN
jgi:two-component system OmpR family sensor kinase